MISLPANWLRQIFKPSAPSVPPLSAAALRRLDCLEYEDRTLFSATPMGAEALVAQQAAEDPQVQADSSEAAANDASDAASTETSNPHDGGFTNESSSETGDTSNAGDQQTDEVRDEVVFVDGSIRDVDLLIDDLLANADSSRRLHVVILDPSQDGISQITEALAEYQDLSAVHFVTHASAGELTLGNTQLDAANFSEHAEQIQRWRGSLAEDADLLFYGCELAGSESGRALLTNIEQATGADVAASTDNTGTALFGGDWQLEYASGGIETAGAFTATAQQNWIDLLNVAVDNASSNTGDSVGSVTVSHTTAGTNRLMLVAVNIDPHGVSATSVTYNGVSLNFEGAVEDPGAHSRVEIWSLVAPATGTHDVEVTLSDSNFYRGVIVGVMTFTGVDQSNPLENFNTAFGNGTSASVTISSQVGDMVFAAVHSHDPTTTTPGGSQTEHWDQIVDQSSSSGTTEAGAASVNNTWTVGADDWAVAGVSIRAYTNTAPTLITTETPVLGSVNEDNGAPSGAVGTLISSLIDYASPSGQVDNVTDPDADSLGIAVTAANTTNGSWWYSTDNGSNWNALGSVANNNARLLAADANTRIYFQANADYNGTVSNAITFRAWDRYTGTNGSLASTTTNGGTSAFSSATDTANITVNAVNDDPTNTVPGAQVMNEDATLTFSSGNGNQISIADVDAGTVRVTLTATNGTITLNGTAGLSFTVGDGTADATMTFTGTVATINSRLNGLGFTPTGDYNGAANLQIVTNDLGNTGSGGALSDTSNVAITVNAVNDAPSITVPGAQSMNEDATLTFSSGNGNQISIADVDAASSSVLVTLSLSSGTMTLNGVAGLSFITGDGTADATLQFTGTVAAVNTALNGLVFTPGNNFNGAVGLGIVVNDQGNTGSGGAQSDTDAVAITVNAVNDAPVNTVPGAQSINEDATLTFSAGNGNQISIADVDAASGSVQVTLTATNGAITLSGVTGLSFSVGTGTADATMTFTGTIANINTALNGLVFTPTADYNGAANLQIVTNDLGNTGSPGAQSDTDNIAITVNAVNDAPVNIFPEAVSTNADIAIEFSVLNGNGISLSDVDLGGSPIRLTLTSTNGVLTLSGTTGLTFNAGSNGSAAMIITGTLTDINNALEGMLYTPTLGYVGTASITLTSNDLGSTGSGGAQSDVDTIEVQMVPVTIQTDPVNTTVAKAQNEVAIAMDAMGNYVVVWTSDQQDGDGKGVYGQRYDLIGNKVGGEFLVNTTTAHDQNQAAVAMRGDGSFVVTWTSKDQDGGGKGIYAQRFNSAGVKQGSEFLVNTLTAGDQDNSSVAIDSNGNFVVAWRTAAGGEDVKAQRFNASGVAQGSEFLVNTTTADSQKEPQVAMDANGNFVVVWRSQNLDGSGAGVFGQRYNAAGAAQGGEFQVNTTASGDQNRPFVAMSTVGFVVTWSSGGDQDGDKRGIYMRRYDASGVAQSGETQVNTYTVGDQDWSGAAMDSSGNFTVSWMSKDQDGSRNGVYMQRYLANGTANGVETLVNSITAGEQKNPAIASGASGDIALAWNGNGIGDADGVWTRNYHSNVAPVNTVSGAQSVNENANLVFSSGNGNQITISDADANTSQVRVTLTATNGTLTLAGTTGLTITVGDGTADATMTFLGTVANINTALNGLTFSPTADYYGAASVQIVTNDLGNIGSGGAQSDSDTIAVTVNPVNDAPVNTVPGPQSTNEDTTLVFSSGNGNQISIADIDAGSGNVRVTLTAANGAVTLNGTTGLSFTVGDGTADATMTFTGTMTDINTALNGLGFTPTNNFNGAASLQIVTNDLGNTGTPGALSDTDSIAITVNPVNDAPVNTVPGPQSVNEDATLVFSSGNGNQISIADVDAGAGTVQVTLTVTNGTLTLNGTTGLSFSAGDGTADATMTFTGTMASINTALNGLAFTPTNHFNGAASLQIVTDDQGNSGSGGPLSDTDSVAITVNSVNDAPVNTVPGPQMTNEDVTLVFSGANGNQISIADLDAGSGTVRVQLTATNGTISLNGTIGLSFTVGDGAADGTMTFTGTISDINAALDGLGFNPTFDFNGAASLQIVTNDLGNTGLGGALGDTDVVAITVGDVNDDPVNTVPGPQSTSEDTPLVFSGANGNQISIADVDAGSATVQVTLTANNGTITLSGMTGLTFLTGTGTNDAVMTFTGTMTDINAALDGLSFTPTLDFTGAASLQITTDDLGNTGLGGQLSDTDVVAINVGGVNDAPTLSVPGPQSTPFRTDLVFLSSSGNALILADLDAGSGQLRLTLTAAHGTLSLAQLTGLTLISGTGSNDVTVIVEGSLSDLNAAVEGMLFTPTATYRGAATIDVSLDDLGNTGAGGPLSVNGQVNIDIQPAAQRLQFTGPTAQEADNFSAVFSANNGNALQFYDVYEENPTLTVSIGATLGTFSLSTTNGLTFLSGSNGTTSMSFTGALTDVNAALDGAEFSTDQSSSSLSISAFDPPRDGTGPQSAGTTIEISQISFPPPAAETMVEVIEEIVETNDSDEGTTVVAPPTLTQEADKAHAEIKHVKRPVEILVNSAPKSAEFADVQKQDVAESTAGENEFIERLVGVKQANGSLNADKTGSRSASAAQAVPWSKVIFMEEENAKTALSDDFIVGTAGITASLSVGYALWSIRAASLFSTMLSSMPAWQSFDPLPVINVVASRKGRDDDDDDTSQLF